MVWRAPIIGLRHRMMAIGGTLAGASQFLFASPAMATDPGLRETGPASAPLIVPSPAVQTFLETQDRLEATSLRIARAANGQCANRWRHPGVRTHKLGDYPRELRRDLKGFAVSDPRILTISDPNLRDKLVFGDALIDAKGRALDANSQDLQIQLALGKMSVLRAGKRLMVEAQSPQLCYRPIHLTSSGTVKARTTPNAIEVSQGLVNYVRSDDELAYAIAHEMSHFMLDHSRILSEARSSGTLTPSLRRSLETDADRGAIYLMHQAQYDVTAALSFVERSSFLRDFPLLGLSSHPSRSQRLSDVSAAISAIRLDPDPPQTVGSFVERFHTLQVQR